MSGHTPGPWRYVPWHIAEGDSRVRAPNGTLICCTSSDANAHLIAAAPDMHDALLMIAGDGCTNYTTGHGSCAKNGRKADAQFLADKWCDACIAHAAIAKTEGKPQGSGEVK